MWSLPNLLTLFRALAALPVAAFVLAGWWEAAFVLFAVAAATDWLDGYLARRWNQESAFGRFLDPIADKLMVAAVLVVLMARLPGTEGAWTQLFIWSAVLVLLRELLVAGLREYLGPRGVVVHVSALAKWKTATQLLAVALLLLSGAVWAWSASAAELSVRLGLGGVVLLALSALLAWVTAWRYLKAGLGHMEAR